MKGFYPLSATFKLTIIPQNQVTFQKHFSEKTTAMFLGILNAEEWTQANVPEKKACAND